MKLSEAILLGSVLGPQCHELWQEGDKSCAFGAAQLAMGIRDANTSHILRLWPWLKQREFSNVTCPECDQTEIYCAVVHLNDTHKWTRERIAEFVATVEPPETCSECHSEQPVNEIQVCQECQP